MCSKTLHLKLNTKAPGTVLILWLLASACAGEGKSMASPEAQQNENHYLFYLHGMIVETLSSKGFEVISEIRPAKTDTKQYAGLLTAHP